MVTETQNLYTDMHTDIIHIHIHMYIHAFVYPFDWCCCYYFVRTCLLVFLDDLFVRYKSTYRYIHIEVFINIHTYTHIWTHIQHVHIHTRKDTLNNSASATAWGADTDVKNSEHLFSWTQSTIFSTSNDRISLYPLPETPIPLNLPSPLPNIPQNSWWTEASVVLLFHTDQHNRIHHSEEVPHNFTMGLCIVVERL